MGVGMPYICGLPNDRASTFNILHSTVPYDTFWRMAPTRETLTGVGRLQATACSSARQKLQVPYQTYDQEVANFCRAGIKIERLKSTDPKILFSFVVVFAPSGPTRGKRLAWSLMPL